jgi:hypothetical protein
MRFRWFALLMVASCSEPPGHADSNLEAGTFGTTSIRDAGAAEPQLGARAEVIARKLTTPQPAPSRLPVDFQRGDCSEPLSATYFFERESFVPRSSLSDSDRFFSAWYSGVLRSFREASLSCLLPAPTTYRLLVLPCCQRPASVVRIESTGRRATLSVTQLDREYPNPFASLDDAVNRAHTVAVRARRELFAQEIREVMAGVDSSNFWNLEQGDHERFRCYGDLWVLEGRDANRYHVVDRCGPVASVRHPGRTIARLAGIIVR